MGSRIPPLGIQVPEMGGLVPRDASSGRRTAVASWLPETGNRGARGREGPAGKRVKSSSSGRRARIAGAWGVGAELQSEHRLLHTEPERESEAGEPPDCRACGGRPPGAARPGPASPDGSLRGSASASHRVSAPWSERALF